VYLLRDYIRIGEDTRADDSAHHDHRGVKEPETPGEMWLSLSLR
jgi:hypothetical protein